MESQLENMVRIACIQNLKNPEILMHPKDLEVLTTQLKKSVKNFKESKNPKYKNIPIRTNDRVDRGIFYISEKCDQDGDLDEKRFYNTKETMDNEESNNYWCRFSSFICC